MLDGDESAVVAELWTTGASGGAPTDQLIADQSVVCWTCGKRHPVEPDRRYAGGPADRPSKVQD